MPKRRKDGTLRSPTTGKSKAPAKQSIGGTIQSYLQGLRNTLGLTSYTPEHMIRELERMADEQSNKVVRQSLQREADLLKKLVKGGQND